MSRAERLALYVALTAITALAIDGVLPAMPMIEAAFSPSPPFSGAQIITAFVLGMAIGELVIGPFSDAAGRRPAVIFGLAIFVFGTVVAATADTFSAVIIGRFFQGVGVAGPKIGTRAMIRDRYAGNDMAKVMSVIFTLLILVPMIAPAIGAAVAAFVGWRGVFWAYLVLAAGLGTWLWARHPETLTIERRVPLQLWRLTRNIKIVASRFDVMPVVIATGFVFGAQLTYFTVAADLFGVLYGLPELMPALFALLATGMGAALLLNVRLVGRTGMEVPIFSGLLLLGASGMGLLAAAALTDGHPPLAALIGLAWFGFFALGLLFGNLNAFAMRPLGDLAGLGSSIIASVSSIVAFVFASAIELMAEGPVRAVAWAFVLAALLSTVFVLLAIPDGSRKRLLRIIGIGR
ncbi:MFS transporter [Pseudophaeobacter arcticus]|jgi:DHA1 family bicyclomycin/chloramphenicol resistance-like MFS transporter|uniref:MFS transporter n=1 Tax=Pseudophaeobacter arcticus TaxID=385492 RepID=UPI0039E68D50